MKKQNPREHHHDLHIKSYQARGFFQLRHFADHIAHAIHHLRRCKLETINGISEIGYLPGQILNKANGISDDGLKIYGRGDQQPYFTWTSADGIEPITLPDGFSANFHAISGDGTALAGKYISPNDDNGPVPDEAFRLVGDTVTRLGFLSTTGNRSIAQASTGESLFSNVKLIYISMLR